MSGETITDDEFERLLDELHGAGKGPTGALKTAASSPGDPLVLGEALRIDEARGLTERLRERLDVSGEIVIDAAAVEHVDTAGLQILTAFAQGLRARGSDLRWTNVPPVLAGAATALGLVQAAGLG